tara:strand:- start:2109 stop:2270 length:162 start_codon:yes stop_codon:yes gene_type:complete
MNPKLEHEFFILKQKLEIALEGLNVIISDGGDFQNIAKKTIKHIEDLDKPRDH